jgi:hypothetical protein
MKNLILLILSVTLLSGCVTQDRCSRKFPPETIVIRTDSIINTTETVYRDTTIYIHIPSEIKYSTDTVIIKDGIIQSRKNHLTTSFAQSWAWVERGRLYHELSQNDTLIRQDIKDAIRVTWERAERYYKESQQTVVTKKYVPLFYKIMTVIAFIVIAYYILRIIAIFKK